MSAKEQEKEEELKCFHVKVIPLQFKHSQPVPEEAHVDSRLQVTHDTDKGVTMTGEVCELSTLPDDVQSFMVIIYEKVSEIIILRERVHPMSLLQSTPDSMFSLTRTPSVIKINVHFSSSSLRTELERAEVVNEVRLDLERDADYDPYGFYH